MLINWVIYLSYWYERSILPAFLKDYSPIYKGIQGVVFSYAYVSGGMMFGATLPDQDIACNDLLAAKFLDA